jgi:hypothetical protein
VHGGMLAGHSLPKFTMALCHDDSMSTANLMGMRARVIGAVSCLLQGVMLDIVAMILIVVEENLPFGVLWTPWSDLFYALMFWLVFLVLVYCLFFCFM